jgi:hypothetical protein
MEPNITDEFEGDNLLQVTDLRLPDVFGTVISELKVTWNWTCEWKGEKGSTKEYGTPT